MGHASRWLFPTSYPPHEMTLNRGVAFAENAVFAGERFLPVPRGAKERGVNLI